MALLNTFRNTFRWRLGSLRILFVTIGIANLFFLIWSGWVVLKMPYDGLTVSDDYRVLGIDSGSPAELAGFQVGDQITSINDVNVTSLHSLYTGLHIGDVAEYALIRDNRPYFLELELIKMPSYRRLAEFEAILVGGVFWLISFIVLSVAVPSTVSSIFFLMGQTAALLLSAGTVSSFKINSIENYLFTFALLLLTPLFLHFYLAFPLERSGKRSRTVRSVIYGIAVLLGLIYVLVTYFGIQTPLLVFINDQRLLFTSFVLFAALASLFLLRPGDSMHTLRQQRLLIVGMLLSVLPLLTLSFLPQLITSRPLVDYIWTFPFLVLLPISYAYAVHQENLGGFDHILKTGLLYLASAGLLLLIYFASVEILRHILPTPLYRWGHLLAGITVLIIAIIWGEWIKYRFNRLLDQFFYRHWYDYRSIIQQNSHYLSGTVHLERLAQSLLQNARTMRFLEAALLWSDGDELRSYQSFGYSEAIAQSFWFRKDDFVVRKLANIGTPCLTQRLLAHESNSISVVDERSKRCLADGKVQIWVPFTHGSGEVTGILLLGSRVGDEPLDREDWDILETLAGHISLAVENINLVETLRNQLKTLKRTQQELIETKLRLSENRERERLELARILHDGPIQDIYGVIYQLAIWRKLEHQQEDSNLDAVESGLMMIEKSLRFFSSELRPPALDSFGLEGAIRSHISNLREAHPNINFYPDLMRLEQLISSEYELSFFRIYQESVRNALKHAQATKIWVRLFKKDDQIILEVEDNGVGFNIPDGWMDLAREGHFGMLGITERVDIIGGDFEIISSPGTGTLIRISVPLQPVHA